VNDVVPATTQHFTHLPSQAEANRDPRLRSVAVNGLTAAKPDDVRLFLRARNVRGDDIDVMTAPARLASKEMHVLTNAAEVRIVILRHQRDAQRAVIPNDRQMRQLGKRGMST
jgi:hypothetical protein